MDSTHSPDGHIKEWVMGQKNTKNPWHHPETPATQINKPGSELAATFVKRTTHIHIHAVTWCECKRKVKVKPAR